MHKIRIEIRNNASINGVRPFEPHPIVTMPTDCNECPVLIVPFSVKTLANPTRQTKIM